MPGNSSILSGIRVKGVVSVRNVWFLNYLFDNNLNYSITFVFKTSEVKVSTVLTVLDKSFQPDERQ